MNSIELLEDYKKDVDSLQYKDDDHFDKLRRKGKMLIKNIYGESSEYMDDFIKISPYASFGPLGEDTERRIWESGKSSIINLINTMLEETTIFGAASESSNKTSKSQETENNRVFIVHGHDDKAKIMVARFIEQLNLKAIILHEQASKGKTIIEKFEEQASISSFAIVLLTPDDVGFPQKKENEAKPRARQNVIFELGYFCGVLKRKNVCVLYKEGVEIPNDYLGVVYTPLDEAGAWQMLLAREMKHAGIAFDMNKVID